MARRKRVEADDPSALRAYDSAGNVRPADDRYLNADQAEAVQAYVAEQAPEAAVADEVSIDDVAAQASAIAHTSQEDE